MSNSVDICPFDDDLTCPLDYHTCEIYRERMEEEHAISESSGDVYLDPSCNDLLPICRELIAEVEWLRSKEAHYQGVEDWYIANHLYEKYRLPGDALAGEIERLRSLNESLMENGNDLRTRCQKAEARIKELESERDYWRELFQNIQGDRDLLVQKDICIERLEAAFLKAEKANLMHHMDADYADENAREALERIKEGGKDE